MCFLHRMCTSVCQCTCVYMHLCSNRQCIYVSLQSPLIYHAISAKWMLSFQFFLFLFFLFFFFADGVQLCDGVRVHSIHSCRFLGDAPPLGFSSVRTFFLRMVASSLWRAFSGGHHAHRYTVSPCRSHVFFFCSLHSISAPTSMH